MKGQLEPSTYKEGAVGQTKSEGMREEAEDMNMKEDKGTCGIAQKRDILGRGSRGKATRAPREMRLHSERGSLGSWLSYESLKMRGANTNILTSFLIHIAGERETSVTNTFRILSADCTWILSAVIIFETALRYTV